MRVCLEAENEHKVLRLCACVCLEAENEHKVLRLCACVFRGRE